MADNRKSTPPQTDGPDAPNGKVLTDDRIDKATPEEKMATQKPKQEPKNAPQVTQK